ncbi:hypothetical protein DY000_02053909 [Brassica cretica]|uniref:Uncharacterized protein n=1 Tax=Brassica cretica TaxID=69181 RepID=A0ABQ7AJF9_BRACR|nr:hypothetical protein DY000_02053909 [Brassica cretica]
MFRLHFAYMSPYQVLEYHMEFLETFGCNWSPKEMFKVIIGRAPYQSDQSGATLSSHSDLPIRATLPERQGRVARVLITRRCENESGATSRSDTARQTICGSVLALSSCMKLEYYDVKSQLSNQTHGQEDGFDGEVILYSSNDFNGVSIVISRVVILISQYKVIIIITLQ